MSTDIRQIRGQLFNLLAPESGFFKVAIVYGVAISLITLAVPIAVQTLINTIANIGSFRAVVILAVLLFVILLAGAVLSALRLWVMELYKRKVFTRLTAEMSLRLIMAPHSHFSGRRNAGLMHRYFDVMTLQKNIPRLVIDGFALLLQTLVGFTLVSFYHPWLFLFNLATGALVWFAWRFWANDAKRSAVKLSKEKYRMGRWLSDIEAAHEFFKSRRHLAFAAKSTNSFAEDYILEHTTYFGYTFRQTLSFLLIYALGSAALLGVGGWLVVNNQLTIGQLVAAELVMASVFVGLARFASFLKAYYELYGSADKLGELLNLPQEDVRETQGVPDPSQGLQLESVGFAHHDLSCKLSLTIPRGKKLFITTDQTWLYTKLVGYLRCYEKPASGWISLDGLALADYNSYELRELVYPVDRSLIMACSVADFLKLAAPTVTEQEMKTALEKVFLWEAVNALPEGLNTQLSTMGAPLQALELLLLKLAAALLANPKLIILNQHFDALPDDRREQLFRSVSESDASILYFTGHPIEGVFDEVRSLCALPTAGATSASDGHATTHNEEPNA